MPHPTAKMTVDVARITPAGPGQPARGHVEASVHAGDEGAAHVTGTLVQDFDAVAGVQPYVVGGKINVTPVDA